MSPATEKTQAWFKITWPVFVFIFLQAGVGVNAYYSLKAQVNQHIAVDTQDAKHTQETLVRIEADLKEIKSILMNPVR